MRTDEATVLLAFMNMTYIAPWHADTLHPHTGAPATRSSIPSPLMSPAFATDVPNSS